MNATEYVRHTSSFISNVQCLFMWVTGFWNMWIAVKSTAEIQEFVKYMQFWQKYMKFDRMKCKHIVLKINCHNKFPFFSRKGLAIYLNSLFALMF